MKKERFAKLRPEKFEKEQIATNYNIDVRPHIDLIITTMTIVSKLDALNA